METQALFAGSLLCGLGLALATLLPGRLPRFFRIHRLLGHSSRLSRWRRGGAIPTRLKLGLLSIVCTSFGAVGLASFSAPGGSLLATLAPAAFCGLLIGGIGWRWLGRFALGSQTVGIPSGRSLLGVSGRVSMAIPEGGIGQVAYVAEGKRSAMPARTRSGRPLQPGASVFIVGIEAHVAEVEEG